MLRPLVIACFLALLTSTAAGNAAEPESGNAKELARQRFREAFEAFEDGRYSAAASLFEAADRLAPHASITYNAATSWDQAGEAARAATTYEAALELESLDAGRRQEAEERLGILKAGLGKVHIKQPLGAFITVDHMQRAPVPAVFYLRPGTYDIRVEYRGTESTTVAEVHAAAEHEVKLDLPASVLPQAPPPAAPPPTLPPDEPPPPPATDSGTTQRTLGWIGIGASVALSGAAVVFGVRALSAKDRFDRSGNTSARDRSDAADFRLATNVLWGGATLTGATGLVLLLTAPTIEF